MALTHTRSSACPLQHSGDRRPQTRYGGPGFAVGSTERTFYRLHISFSQQIDLWRVGVWIVPVIVFFATRQVCRALARSGTHPLREWEGVLLERRDDGAFEVVAESSEGPGSEPADPQLGTAPGQRSLR